MFGKKKKVKKTTYVPETPVKKEPGKNSDKGNNEGVNNLKDIKKSKWV